MSARTIPAAIRLLPFLSILLVAGCIPIPTHHSVPAETAAIDLPETQFTRIAVAPYLHRAEVNRFIQTLTKTDRTIEAVDATRVLEHAFPDRSADLEVSVSELLRPDAAERIKALGVRFVVVLSPYQTGRSDDTGTFIGVYAHVSEEISTTLLAGLIDLEQPGTFGYLETQAGGKESATWILPYLGLFIFGSTPKTEESAMDGVALRVVEEIRQLLPAGTVQISVVAGDWESAALSYKKEQALEALQERARAGDAEAQWTLYQELPTAKNLVWLCRAADQGHRKARTELGQLYFYGSDTYRQFESVHVAPDFSRACMWFHLAGQATVGEQPPSPIVPPLTGTTETAEVARTAQAMSERERQQAEILLLNWAPGQCAREFSAHPGSSHATYADLLVLCTAADLGDFAAREELGRIHFFGARGVGRDLPRAFMWYRLAAKVYAPLGIHSAVMQPLCDAMTPDQRHAAERLLRDWQQGQCELRLLSPGEP